MDMSTRYLSLPQSASQVRGGFQGTIVGIWQRKPKVRRLPVTEATDSELRVT